jgi:hypothetical protein
MVTVTTAAQCQDVPPAALPHAGQRPTDQAQLDAMKAARQRLADALARQDANLIESAEAEFRKSLGVYAGVPEDEEDLRPKDTAAPRPTKADFEKLTRSMPTLASGSDYANMKRMELRHAAYLAIGLLAMSEADLPDAAAYRKQAAIELDYLVSKQAPEGFFPYPADPVAPPHLQKGAALVAKAYPDKVKDGYIYLDVDGAQFDAGCCSYALAYGYQLLKEERFLKAARKAGDWALAKPLTVNWNYNSFSVWQLAKLYEVTKEKKFLDGAIRLTQLGVLPGRLDSGRWSDQHNAKRVYHWIMVRALVALLRVMPEDDADRRSIHEKTVLAINARVEDTLRDGGGKEVHALVALIEALDYFGPNERWEKAVGQTGGVSPYSAGVFARSQRGL